MTGRYLSGKPSCRKGRFWPCQWISVSSPPRLIEVDEEALAGGELEARGAVGLHDAEDGCRLAQNLDGAAVDGQGFAPAKAWWTRGGASEPRRHRGGGRGSAPQEIAAA